MILYELLTGRLPFRGDRRDMEDAILRGKPDRPSRLRASVPRELERICLKAMERLIDDRFDSMHEFAAAVDEYQGGLEPAAPALPRSSRRAPAGPELDPARPALHRHGASSRR